MRYFGFSELDDFISTEQVLPNSIEIFDDIACVKQKHVRYFFCMGRLNNVDCFYINQSYARIPMHLICEK